MVNKPGPIGHPDFAELPCQRLSGKSGQAPFHGPKSLRNEGEGLLFGASRSQETRDATRPVTFQTVSLGTRVNRLSVDASHPLRSHNVLWWIRVSERTHPSSPEGRSYRPEVETASEIRDVRRTTCCVVGGGPGGAVLSLLLARAGVDVTLLEAHPDFDREFRGDT